LDAVLEAVELFMLVYVCESRMIDAYLPARVGDLTTSLADCERSVSIGSGCSW
jgi:hypothetical protein